MPYLHACKLRAQVFMQLLGEINRPVLSASATDCNRNIASVDLTEVMEHLFDKSAQLFIERQTPFITFQKLSSPAHPSPSCFVCQLASRGWAVRAHRKRNRHQ